MGLSGAIIGALALKAGAVGIHLTARRKEHLHERASPPRGQRLRVGDTAVHCKVEGSGPPLVLIHGASGNLNDFDPLAASLSDRFTVVRFDRPGLGWSDLPREYRSIWRDTAPGPQAQAAILRQAYDQLGLGPALVLGQSFGGAVALAWALDHPDTVTGLVLVSAASMPWPGGLDPFYPMASHPLGALTLVPTTIALAGPKSIAPVIDKIFAPQQPPEGYADWLGIGLTMRRRTFRANARQVNGLRPHLVAMAPRYPGLRLPVELVHGEADTIVPLEVHSAPLSQILPQARLTRLPGIGHMPHHSAPQAVLDAITRATPEAFA